MGPNIAKARMGVCSVKFKGVDLGHTLGGVSFSAERQFEDMYVDKYGETPIDKILTGQNLTITFTLAQPELYNLDVAFPEGVLEQGSVALEDRLGLGRDAGHGLRTEAGQLVLHPVKNLAANDSEDIVIYKAVSVETVELNYRVDEQMGLEITMQALVDESYQDGRRLGHIGAATIS